MKLISSLHPLSHITKTSEGTAVMECAEPREHRCAPVLGAGPTCRTASLPNPCCAALAAPAVCTSCPHALSPAEVGYCKVSCSREIGLQAGFSTRMTLDRVLKLSLLICTMGIMPSALIHCEDSVR